MKISYFFYKIFKILLIFMTFYLKFYKKDDLKSSFYTNGILGVGERFNPAIPLFSIYMKYPWLAIIAALSVQSFRSGYMTFTPHFSPRSTRSSLKYLFADTPPARTNVLHLFFKQASIALLDTTSTACF